MPWTAATVKNAFLETMLGLELTPEPGREADLFSVACTEMYSEHQPDVYGYLLAQVFEPNVLREVAILDGQSVERVADLSHRSTSTMEQLADRVARAGELPVVALINTATALLSVSRFDPAEALVHKALSRSLSSHEAFEAWMLKFIVTNRRDDGKGSAESFERMRSAIEVGPVPPQRALDACAQAVVWYMKRREIPQDTFRWFVTAGRELVRQPNNLAPASISAWYRALAMVPAAAGKTEQTRAYMVRARDAASETFARRPRAYEAHLLKTYYESSVKEHMYLTRDFDRAEESGRALIDLDPVWAPSYGELAEVYLKFGKPEKAAALYDAAVAAGPPYYGHHLLHAARTHAACGNGEEALARYRALADLVPDDVTVLGAALELARSVDAASVDFFQDLIDRRNRLAAEPGERSTQE